MRVYEGFSYRPKILIYLDEYEHWVSRHGGRRNNSGRTTIISLNVYLLNYQRIYETITQLKLNIGLKIRLLINNF